MAPQPKQTAEERAQSEQVNRQDENREAVVGSEEDVLPERETVSPKQDQEDDVDDSGVQRREPIHRAPSDDIRSQIAARFRRAEPEDERPFNNDMNDPENIYGTVAQQDEDELSDEEIEAQAREREALGAPPMRPKPKPQAPAADVDQGSPERMITRIVRGQKVTLSEQEWLDRASQVTAAESYLAEAREILQGAKQLRGRPAPDRQHPDGDQGTYEGVPSDDGGEPEVQHPELSTKTVINKLLYSDPDEAAADLERLIDERAGKKASEGQLQRAYDQDLARSQAQLKIFADANKDLAADEYASMAIERGMYHLYEEDILALGVNKDQLPQNTRELANWHRFYRMNGYDVRSTKELLETSKEKFLQWRDGGSPQRRSDNQQQPSRRPPPSVQVNVQRDQRRMAIPNQPTRAAVPRRDVQAPVRQSGSDVVANMRRARGQV
jgi:hypothetical protein